MGLSIPKYIKEANIQNNIIQYKWDDWNTEQAEEPIDEKLYMRLERISQRATIAFTIGTAEWIVYRLESVSDTLLLFNYLEAAWAQIIHWKYASYSWEGYNYGIEWSGPIRGPLGIAMTRVMYALQRAEEDEDPELRAAWISNLAQHLITNPTPYQNWREFIIKRLEILYPRNPDERLGEVVPREVMDPAFYFKVEQTENLINQFLIGLDYNTNPFLNSPKKMLEQGLDGTPYIFDINRDRQNRFKL